MLPIHEVLPALKAALARCSAAVLVAPPGAGKTTVVPLALMDQPWAGAGKIIVLEPRRLAARAAAARMAQTLGEAVGETVGYRVRLDARTSARTRIEVVTEGVFSRMVLDDPGLDGVAAVLFDEFHERSLDGDLGLALARDSQGLLREDLRLVVMSATIEGSRIAALLGDCPVIESQGRQYPVETRYLGRDPALRLEDRMVRAIRTALAETDGGVLVFLPGQGEIRRVAERLAEQIRDPSVDIAPLYGALDAKDQDLAIEAAPTGRRKVVLATAIAETSLTIAGVRVVIDGGLARVPCYDPARGLTRLETVRVSQAAADQRRGRAGRTEPGVCYRLWDEPETRALPAYARPEILETDLARLALDLARWGARDAAALAFLDQPPAAAMAEARALLARLGALDGQGDLTAHGRAIADLPLPPRLAHMVLVGAKGGAADEAAQLAVLITEQGLGGGDVDLSERRRRLARDAAPRARDARALAARWARSAKAAVTAAGEGLTDGQLLAAAFPERIAKARGGLGEFQLASGRGAYLEPADALAREPWLAIAELGGGEARDRILSAVRLEAAGLTLAFKDQIETEDQVRLDAQGRVSANRVRRLGRIVIDERRIDRPDPALIATALADQVRREGVGALPWGAGAVLFRARVNFMRAQAPDVWPDLSDAALLARLDQWLEPVLIGKTRLTSLEPGALDGAVRALLPWDQQRTLDQVAPEAWTAPTGTRVSIDYAADAGPALEVRVQELFGLGVHPTVAHGQIPLILSLLSPARRPIQTTRDLPGFWRGSWSDVRKDMRGRYPKHPWPEDPLAAPPTTRVKPRG